MRCDVCNLPDLRGGGDGIGSCDCARCDCGEAAGSQFCTCLTEDDLDQWPPEPPCWKPGPGGLRCGLDVDHDGEHYFNTSEA